MLLAHLHNKRRLFHVIRAQLYPLYNIFEEHAPSQVARSTFGPWDVHEMHMQVIECRVVMKKGLHVSSIEVVLLFYRLVALISHASEHVEVLWSQVSDALQVSVGGQRQTVEGGQVVMIEGKI